MEDELHTRTYTVAMNRLEWPGYEISGVTSIKKFAAPNSDCGTEEE